MRLKIILFLPPVLLVACIVVVLVNTSGFKKKVGADVVALLANSRPADTSVVTEADLVKFPSPIQRYLKYSGVVGKPRVNSVRLRQKGFFRSKPDQSWMPFEAEQYYTVNPPGFVWFARMKAFPLVTIQVRDMYAGGKGNMLGQMMGTITVVEASDSKELNQGAMVRFLSEMIWFPTAWLSDYLSWEEIDSSSARVTMQYGGVSASAILHINEVGEYVNLEASRYMTSGDIRSFERWSTPTMGYGEFHGLRIPARGQAVWNLKSGDFPYIQVEVESVQYDRLLFY